MRLPTPADLCWNVKCSPDQEWIERTLRIAVENVWPQALETAHSRNGHGSHVVEIVESAIEHAVCRLKTGDPLGPEQVTQLLQRLVLQEVRRRRRANAVSYTHLPNLVAALTARCTLRAVIVCAPSMGALLRVQVPSQAGHSE